MKVAPVSADLLIKLAVGAAVLGLGYWAINRSISGLKDTLGAILDAPGKVYDTVVESVVETAREGGAAWQAGYVPNPDYGNEGRNYGTPKYSNPLVNDQGYDFGQLSG